MILQYKLTEAAKALKESTSIDCTPKRQHSLDAGFDLRACITEPLKVFPEEVVKVPTGVCVWLGSDIEEDVEPADMLLAGLYLPRSSTKGLQLTNTVGLLDAGYQHESFCKWINKSNETVTINPGDRMAQLVIIPVIIGEWEKVDEFRSTSDRGAGDGSSGVS